MRVALALEVGLERVAGGGELAVGADDARAEQRGDLGQQLVLGLVLEPDADHAALALDHEQAADRGAHAGEHGVGEALAHRGGGDGLEQAVGERGHAAALSRRVRTAEDTRWRAATAEILVRALWTDLPMAAAVGRRLRITPGGSSEPIAGDVEIVGIARNAKYRTLGEPGQPHVYLPIAQHYVPGVAVLVRARAQPLPFTDVQAALAGIDPAVQGFFTRTLEQHTRVSLLPSVFASRVSTVVGLVSAVLGTVGLYGLIACVVAERKRELAVQLALGATPTQIAIGVVKQAARLTSIGCAAGMAAALAGTQLLSSLLYGISTLDPAVYLAVLASAALVTIVSAWIPARRAAGIDALATLKT